VNIEELVVGPTVVDELRGVSVQKSLPYRNLVSDGSEIAHLLIVTHKNWQLMTPIDGRSFSQQGVHTELSFGSKLGVISQPDDDGFYLKDGNYDILPTDIAEVIAAAACVIWDTEHFDMNTGWNATNNAPNP
jgi:hypothetical protein